MPWTSPTPVKQPGSGVTPVRQLSKPVPILPPIGINQVDPLAQFPPLDAIFMYNMIAAKYGTRVRTGYAEYSTTVGAGGVKTIIPYVGSVTLKDRLYAAATTGIYNISSSGAAPASSILFPAATNRSGQGIWSALTVVGGFYTTYCDEEYGAYRYTEATDTWVRTTNVEITGVDPALLCFVTIYKSRQWFIQRDTSDAWFLPVGSVIGAATKFTFGNKFKHGGTLQALYSWPLMDSGAGLDEYLVAISSSGEVIVYKGIDPTADPTLYPTLAFTQVGSWFIGAVPVGRRVGGIFGGDLYLLSIYGLLPMSKLVQGNLAQVDAIELTRKISPAVKTLMATTRTTVGWEVKLIPDQNALIITSPDQPGYPSIQLVQALNNQGWSVYQTIPMFTGEVWQGVFYFGALNGNVYTHTGNADNVNLAQTSRTAISSSVLGSFQDHDEPGLNHRGMFIRPVFLAGAAPAYTAEVRYDYNISEILTPGIAAPPIGVLWDSGIWDLSLWGGSFLEVEAVKGGKGMGRAVAIALAMQTTQETVLIRYDLAFDTGGFL